MHSTIDLGRLKGRGFPENPVNRVGKTKTEDHEETRKAS